MSNASIQAIQVFQKPDTGAAMDSGNLKPDPADLAVSEVQKAIDYIGVIKKGEV
jgi:hypothetical protein